MNRILPMKQVRRNQGFLRGWLRCLAVIPAVLMLAGLHAPPPCFSKSKWGGERLLEDRNARWQITARHLSYNAKENLYTAKGDVTISKGDNFLFAERAMYNEKTGIVQVTGDVRLESHGDLITGETGIFDLKSHYGQLTRGHIFLRENNVHIRGSSMMRIGPETYVVRGCRVTTCDGDRPAWSITGSEVKITLEGYGYVKNAAFRIKNFPVFYLPYAVFPVKTKRQSGVLPPRVGYSDRNGGEIEIPIFWAISENTDATFYERYMTRRGFMQGLEYRYLARDGSKGTFLLDILRDKVERKDLSDPKEADLSPDPRTNKTRYWLRGRADQEFPLGVNARLDADFVSDQDYLKEFMGKMYGYQARPDLVDFSGRPMDDTYSPLRRSTLRLSRDGENYSLQGQTSYYQRPENPPDDETPQPLLGLAFAGLPSPIEDLPLFYEVGASHDYVWREKGVKGHSIAFSPELTYPFRLGRYLELEQSLAFDSDVQWMDGNTGGNDRQSRAAYESKTRISTILEKTFDIHWGDARRVKHKFVPSLTYTYRGYNDEDRYRPWFEPIDEKGKINTLTLTLENLLDARMENEKGERSYAQWGTFSLSQAYDLHEARRDEEPWRGKQPFEPLTAVLTLTPSPDLDLKSEFQWDHYEDQVTLADLSFEFRVPRSGGRKDSFSVDYLYEKGVTNSLSYHLDLNLTEGFSMGTSVRRDFDRGDALENSYYLDYTAQCWAVRFTVKEEDDSSSFMVTFRLLGLGNLPEK
ncbi:MAG: LPS assembly protein LptD [Deltaproteobacteria bacterium]|nr:LPS assembly protein LptD [Deltaproteobacteria bacterium]